MSYGFEDVVIKQKQLRTAGLHKNAKFIDLSYDATEQYEFLDIEIETETGEKFRERTFGPNPDKVFPKKKYSEGKEVGEETKEEAFNRAINEVSTKLFHLGSVFVERDELKASVAKPQNLKDFVEKVNKAINLSGKKDSTRLNFLTVWKNSDAKQRSNLVIPANTVWVEAYTEGVPAGIKLNRWQQENQTVEKYPYQGNSEVSDTNDTIIGDENTANDGLPF